MDFGQDKIMLFNPTPNTLYRNPVSAAVVLWALQLTGDRMPWVFWYSSRIHIDRIS
jgi:hypothetical protein